MHIKGPTCFEDLKYDYENNLCESYYECCLKRGLVQLDDELHLIMKDMGKYELANKMRDTLCLYALNTNV